LKRLLIALPVVMVLGAGVAYRFDNVRQDLAGQRRNIAAQWANVDLALQSRADLVPDLTAAFKDIPVHDSEAFSRVAAARAALAAAQAPEQKIQANDQLSDALSRLLLLTEGRAKFHPKPNLMDDLADAENRIAVERRKYNEILEHYNAQIQRFPDNVVASLSGFTRNDAYFRTDRVSQADPKVRF
jgi:LemA protein